MKGKGRKKEKGDKIEDEEKEGYKEDQELKTNVMKNKNYRIGF